MNCRNVAILLPESFIRAGIFTDRLTDFISITSSSLFVDTNNPVGLALFTDEKIKCTRVWRNHDYIGELSELLKMIITPKKDGSQVIFNANDGNVGLIALDNTKEPSIRFCDIDELRYYKIKLTGRHITKIKSCFNISIDVCNQVLSEFRESTKDILMTSYKGLRKDGMYRRRCDWSLARGIIHHVYR